MLRDQRLTELAQNDSVLDKFLQKNYDTFAISRVKKEFLKRDLLLLKKSSLDEIRYAILIKSIQQQGGQQLVEFNAFFHKELHEVFLSHGF